MKSVPIGKGDLTYGEGILASNQVEQKSEDAVLDLCAEISGKMPNANAVW